MPDMSNMPLLLGASDLSVGWFWLLALWMGGLPILWAVYLSERLGFRDPPVGQAHNNPGACALWVILFAGVGVIALAASASK